MKIYCLKCKSFTDTTNEKYHKIKSRCQLKGFCTVCNSKKCMFVSPDHHNISSSESSED